MSSYTIFVSVKKNIAIISFLISMVVIISHDIIPHRHIDPDESEMVSNKLTENHGYSNSKDNKNSRNHFPFHQHLLSDGDCLNGRYTAPANKIIKDPHQDLGSLSAINAGICFHKYFTGFVPVIWNPLCSYQFIISLNTTRGSPSIS
jgi:hypothetical protein